MLVEKVGEDLPVEIVVDVSVDIPVTVEELWTTDVVLGGKCMLVDETVVVAVLSKDVVIFLQFSSQQNVLIS